MRATQVRIFWAIFFTTFFNSCGEKSESDLPVFALTFSETDQTEFAATGSEVFGVLKITHQGNSAETTSIENAAFVYTTDGTDPDPNAQVGTTVLGFDLTKNLDATGAEPTYRTAVGMRVDKNVTIKALAVAKVIQKKSEKSSTGQNKESDEEVSVSAEMASASYRVKASSSSVSSTSSSSGSSSTPVRSCDVAFKSNSSYDSGLTMYSQRNMAAESFTVTSTTYVKNIYFQLSRNSTDPLPASVAFSIRADSSGSPDFSTLATVNVDTSTLTTTFESKGGVFASELSLAAGTYWVVVECPTCGGIAAGQTHVNIRAAMVSNVDAGGIYKERLASTAWQTGSVYDMVYDVRQCLTQ